MRPATLNLPGNQWLLTQNEKFWSWGGKWLLLEFTKILLLSETYRRPIRDLLETDMPHRRPTCLIRDQHASSETHWRPTCLIRDPWSPMGLQSGMLVSDEACRSSIGLWWDLLVSDGSQMRHVGLPMRHIRYVDLRWVSDNNNIFVNSSCCMRKLNLYHFYYCSEQRQDQISWTRSARERKLNPETRRCDPIHLHEQFNICNLIQCPHHFCTYSGLYIY